MKKDALPETPAPVPLDLGYLKAHLGLITSQYEACAKDLQFQLTSSPHVGMYNIHLMSTLRTMTSLLERIGAHMEAITVAEGKCP